MDTLYVPEPNHLQMRLPGSDEPCFPADKSCPCGSPCPPIFRATSFVSHGTLGADPSITSVSMAMKRLAQTVCRTLDQPPQVQPAAKDRGPSIKRAALVRA